MALKFQKRKISPTTNTRNPAFEKWDNYRSGFFSPRNQQSENEAFSDESVSRISWSSPSSSDSDLHSSEKPPRLNYLQNHRVVTRLNFDDCVTTKHKTPRKKRAKVSRLFVKHEQSEAIVDTENQRRGSIAMSSEMLPVAVVKDLSVGPHVDSMKSNDISSEPKNDCHIEEESVSVFQNDSLDLSMTHTLEMSNEHFQRNKGRTENDSIHSSSGCPLSTSERLINAENESQYAHGHTVSPNLKCSGALQNDCGSPVLDIVSGRLSKDCDKETIVHMPLKRKSKGEELVTKNYEVGNSCLSLDDEASFLDVSVSLLSKVHSHRRKQSLIIPEEEQHDIVMEKDFYSANEDVHNVCNVNVKDTVRLSQSPVLSVEARTNSRRKRMRRCSEGKSAEQLVKLPVSPVLKTKAVATSHRKRQKYYSQKGVEETVGPSQSPVLKRETNALHWRDFKRSKHNKKAKENAGNSLHSSTRPNILTPGKESLVSDKSNVCKLLNSDLKLEINTEDKKLSLNCEICAVRSESNLMLKTVTIDSVNFLKSVQAQVSIPSVLKDGNTALDRHSHTESDFSSAPQEYVPLPESNSTEYTQKLEQNSSRNSQCLSTHCVSLATDCDGTCAVDENNSSGIQLVHNEESNSEQSEPLQISFLSQSNSNLPREPSVTQTGRKTFYHLNSALVNSNHDFPAAYNENFSQNFTPDISFLTQDPDLKYSPLKPENSIKLLTIYNKSSEAVSPKLCQSTQDVKKPAKRKRVKSVMNLKCITTVKKKETEDEGYQAICSQQFPSSFVTIEHTSSQEEKGRSSQNMQDSQVISQLSSPMKKSKSCVSSPDSSLVNDIIPMELGTLKQTSEVKICMDSAKKKKKRLKKNGLASRLQQLLVRRKSSIRMWQYQQCLAEKRHAKYRAVQFLVTAVWTELSRTIIRCRRHLQFPDTRTCEPCEDQKESSQEEFVNTDVIVVLDGDQAVTAHLRAGSIIQIFPPWQILKVQRLNISILMCMSHFEVISIRPEKSLAAIQNGSKEVLVNEEEFTCKCLTGTQNEEQLCQFRLPRNIFRIFFNEEDQEHGRCESHFSGGASSNSKGTIAEALAGSSFLIGGGIELCITVVGVFCYRHPTHKTGDSDNDHKSNLIWSVLGFDRAKEYCEVVLGHSPCLKFDTSMKEQHKTQQWEDFIQGRAVGKMYRFTGLMIVNKVLHKKSSGLWTLMHVRKTPSFCKLFCKTNGQTPELTIRFETDANTDDNGSLNIGRDTTNNQSILYTFSPLSEEWSCTSMETETISLLVDSFQYITDILRKMTEDMQERCSAIIKLIYVHENLFYCTDTSLNVTNCARDHSSYVIIKVLSTCVVPQEAVKGNITILCLLNVLLSEGKLIADKYTRILTVPRKDADAPVFGLPFKFPDDFLESIAAQKTLIQNFSEMSKVLDLVKVSGCVIGVDEDTAFSWPTCEICGSDFLSEIDGGGFYCEKCNQETETITAMSLEVNISCVEVSEDSKVKIKLLQKSIANLLPPEPSGSEGYDVLSVLGKYIGPITCLVVKINEVLSVKSYHLDEVLLFENI
ncbi:uncharacterized protein LOC126279105 isoform X1 [Schistocerca gregaria]|uniref:uncharacterized protein LOC126279105 isoform X1 n=1 Tax=Schistocerca gregaria TaxID=7010 RepID=UPI00211E3ECC|nr:uncharacterized protein LOC126279105 isoform X1 [Schistocerca gregaria]